jgi:hypothetical protein
MAPLESGFATFQSSSEQREKCSHGTHIDERKHESGLFRLQTSPQVNGVCQRLKSGSRCCLSLARQNLQPEDCRSPRRGSSNLKHMKSETPDPEHNKPQLNLLRCREKIAWHADRRQIRLLVFAGARTMVLWLRPNRSQPLSLNSQCTAQVLPTPLEPQIACGRCLISICILLSKWTLSDTRRTKWFLRHHPAQRQDVPVRRRCRSPQGQAERRVGIEKFRRVATAIRSSRRLALFH